MAVNGLDWLEMARNIWKLMELLELAGTGWNILELTENGWNGWKWLKMAENCWMAGMIENGWPWFKMAIKDWRLLKWLKMVENHWKLLEIAGMVWKWRTINETWLTWLKTAWNGWKWLEMVWMQSVKISFSNNWPSGPIRSISQNIHLCARPSMCLLTYEVPFKRFFAPTSRSRMSKFFRDSEYLGKNNGKKWF